MKASSLTIEIMIADNEASNNPAPVENIDHSQSKAVAAFDLDQHYGVAVHPHMLGPLEAELKPRSLLRLDAASAKHLGTLMRLAFDLVLASCVFCETPILWVIDEVGQVWFALEEIVDIETREFLYPRFKRFRHKISKLGHPALIEGGRGRIGGELIFDDVGNPPAWYISNGSGRYGLTPGRTARHLEEAALLFIEYGLDLRSDFIEPRVV